MPFRILFDAADGRKCTKNIRSVLSEVVYIWTGDGGGDALFDMKL